MARLTSILLPGSTKSERVDQIGSARATADHCVAVGLRNSRRLCAFFPTASAAHAQACVKVVNDLLNNPYAAQPDWEKLTGVKLAADGTWQLLEEAPAQTDVARQPAAPAPRVKTDVTPVDIKKAA